MRRAVARDTDFLMYARTCSDDGQAVFFPKVIIFCSPDWAPPFKVGRVYANQYNNPTAVEAAKIIKDAFRIARWCGVICLSHLRNS
jgi:hypothetical protein